MTFPRRVQNFALTLAASAALLMLGCQTSNEVSISEPDDSAEALEDLSEGFEAFRSEMRAIEEAHPKLKLRSRSENDLRTLVTKLNEAGRIDEANGTMKYLVLKMSVKAFSVRNK